VVSGRDGDHEPNLREPGDRPADEPRLFFKRGKSYPRAIAWFGFRSFWGHLWHLAAAAVATEDIDARDWMTTHEPDALTSRVGEALDGVGDGSSLVQLLERDLWIDYLADTGDDADVSHAVAEFVFRAYRVPAEEGHITAPRGDILMFGGDTAYPVATEMEIHNRVCVPFNRVLRDRQDGKRRVLMGIPGNHDWYDGLDGFARMFRARRGTVGRRSIVNDDTTHENDDTTVDKSGQLGQFVDWVEAFRVGQHVAKRPALPLLGYTPVQNASYWALRLAPDLELWAVDRQLRTVDYTQRSFFLQVRGEGPDSGLLLMLADPAYTMLEPHWIGQGVLDSLEIEMERDEPLVIAGDTHHYCRQQFGRAMHVIAGGGGAFLHPARIQRRGVDDPAAEFPGPKASFALAMQVPWQIAGGRAGFIAHVAAALLYVPIFGMQLAGQPIGIACGLVAVAATIACGLLGGWRKGRPWLIGSLAALCGVWIGMLPWAVFTAVSFFAGTTTSPTSQSLLAYGLSIYPAVLGFGTFLMMLTILGLEQHQAFSALAHPGYKHFVRMRVRRDGSAVDGWVFGKVDTLNEASGVVLVDRWTWNNPRSTSRSGQNTSRNETEQEDA
jgi:hypothetical protein